MEQAASSPAEEHDRAYAALEASIARLDDLGLAADDGRAVVEPASVFHWS